MLPAISFGQQAKKNLADRLFCEWAFKEAITTYEEIIAENDSAQVDPDVYFKLAECYRLMDMPESAARWYGVSVNYAANSPGDYYQYARMLQKVEQYAEAASWFQVFTDSSGMQKGTRGGRAAGTIADITANPLHVEMVNAASVNSRRSEIGPAFYRNGIMFSSDRFEGVYGSRVFKWTGNSFYNVYSASHDGNYNFQDPQLFIATINSEYHDGPITFSQDGKTMIFTRNHSVAEVDNSGECKNRTIYNLKLMQTTYTEDGGWSRATEDPFVTLNNKNYIIGHPSLSSDGKTLYFTSDNDEFPGHSGGSDLYMATLKDGVWSDPVNLGDQINSEEEEGFPFIYQDTILFFASDGNIGNGGMGGLDVYMAIWNKEAKRFENPTNLGTPINSSRDDFGLIVKEKDPGMYYGYVVSSRTPQQDPNKVGGDDIYYFYPKQSLHLMVQARHTETKEGFADANITVLRITDTLSKGVTNQDGEFFDSGILELRKSYTITGNIEGVEVLKTFSTSGYNYGDTVYVYLEYCPVTIAGVITNYLTGAPLADATLQITNQRSGSIFTITSDAQGRYSFAAEPDNRYIVSVGKFGYRTEEKVMNTQGIGCEEVDLSVSLLNLDRFLTNVYYYFDKADIYLYEESVDDLEDLVVYLNENPNLNVELRAHTDSRGSFRYNEMLAQRRAQAVKDFLIDKGIIETRLTPVAYGEYCLENECADGVDCNEVQHQRNRRTEIVVTNLEGEIITQGRELERWTRVDESYVEGGRYFEPGKGSNWYVTEVFEAKHGNWRKVAIRKACD